MVPWPKPDGYDPEDFLLMVCGGPARGAATRPSRFPTLNRFCVALFCMGAQGA
jgi:hypothetical protein